MRRLVLVILEGVCSVYASTFAALGALGALKEIATKPLPYSYVGKVTAGDEALFLSWLLAVLISINARHVSAWRQHIREWRS